MIIENFVYMIINHLKKTWVYWFIVSTLIFFIFPSLDINISARFWNPAHGWYLGKTSFSEFIRRGFPLLVFSLLLFFILLWLSEKIMRKSFFNIKNKIIFYLLLSLIIGPGLIVNTIFKDNWGRARPSQIAEFGGNYSYTPPFIISDNCKKNCSFISGHSALGFWLTAFAFIAPLSWRGRIFLLTFFTGIVVGYFRIIQGAHFLSDVLYSAVFVIMINWILYKIIFIYFKK